MTPEQFRAWRIELGLSQARAGEVLGVSRPTIINYEAGSRREDGRPVPIPKTVALACAAVAAGLSEWPAGGT
ncbi:MAG: helix-turn-helix transcriptional regulator, partial [Rhizobiales bacterium]|nr:helix-turn-helix transcriptional regulator [Hyphomicrobiales bacterium]